MNRLRKPLQELVRHLEADFSREMGVDESIHGGPNQLHGGVGRHLDGGKGLAVPFHEARELLRHLAAQAAELRGRRLGIFAIMKRQQLLALEFPQARRIWGDRGAKLALHGPNSLQACRADVADPATSSLCVTERTGGVPAVALRHGSGFQVTAGENRLQRLVQRVQWNELAGLVGGAAVEVRRKGFRIWTLVVGPRHLRSPII